MWPAPGSLKQKPCFWSSPEVSPVSNESQDHWVPEELSSHEGALCGASGPLLPLISGVGELSPFTWDFTRVSGIKNPPANAGGVEWVPSLSREDSLWRRKRQPTAVFLPGKCHGQRSLEGYTVHGVAESYRTEHEHIHACTSPLLRATALRS